METGIKVFVKKFFLNKNIVIKVADSKLPPPPHTVIYLVDDISCDWIHSLISSGTGDGVTGSCNDENISYNINILDINTSHNTTTHLIMIRRELQHQH